MQHHMSNCGEDRTADTPDMPGVSNACVVDKADIPDIPGVSIAGCAQSVTTSDSVDVHKGSSSEYSRFPDCVDHKNEFEDDGTADTPDIPGVSLA